MSAEYVCDACRDRSKPAIRATLFTGHVIPQEGGGAPQREHRVRDYCLECAVAELERQCSFAGIR